MSDTEKAKRLLETASRVMSEPERDLCRLVAGGLEGCETVFAEICERLEIYLR